MKTENKDLIISKYKELGEHSKELIKYYESFHTINSMKTTKLKEYISTLESELSLLQEQEKEPDIDVCDIVDRYWKFDEQQQHLSSWHDKQDCLKEMKRQIEKHYSLGEVYKRREEIIQMKAIAELNRSKWNFPNEHYIEYTGVIRACDNLLDYLKSNQ